MSDSCTKEDVSVKTKTFLFVGTLLTVFLLSGNVLFAQEDIQKHRSCPYCGMEQGAILPTAERSSVAR